MILYSKGCDRLTKQKEAVTKTGAISIRLSEDTLLDIKAVQQHYSNKVTSPSFADLFLYMLDKEVKELETQGVDITALKEKVSNP